MPGRILTAAPQPNPCRQGRAPWLRQVANSFSAAAPRQKRGASPPQSEATPPPTPHYHSNRSALRRLRLLRLTRGKGSFNYYGSYAAYVVSLPLSLVLSLGKKEQRYSQSEQRSRVRCVRGGIFLKRWQIKAKACTRSKIACEGRFKRKFPNKTT